MYDGKQNDEGGVKKNAGNNKTAVILLSAIALMSLLWGCDVQVHTDANSETVSEIAICEKKDSEFSQQMPEQSDTPIDEAADTSMPTVDESDGVTPYQYLCLFCANAEELSFSYTISRSGLDDVETRRFQRMGDNAVECFSAWDKNGNVVLVRELETNGKVHYILDNKKVIKTYLAPAEDFLLYQMMRAAETPCVRVLEENGYALHEHAFIQEEETQYQYCFYMKDGNLQSLTINSRDTECTAYEFSEFLQETSDPAAFAYPSDYVQESYDYVYTGNTIPPWWETANEK